MTASPSQLLPFTRMFIGGGGKRGSSGLPAQGPPQAVKPEPLGADPRELLDAVAPAEVAAEEAQFVGARHEALRPQQLHDGTVEAGQVRHVETAVTAGGERRLVEVDD